MKTQLFFVKIEAQYGLQVDEFKNVEAHSKNGEDVIYSVGQQNGQQCRILVLISHDPNNRGYL